MPPPSHTPLVALPVLVLDLETTGLNVKADRVVQVAGIFMLGSERAEQFEIDTLVNPQVPIPPASTAIHHISDEQVADAPPFVGVADQLKRLFSGHVVIGHNIGFDIAILRHEFARHELSWTEPPVIDIGQLLGAMQPSLPDTGFETVASALGVRIQDRHSAKGDTLAAAEGWARLIGLLREREVRTLGEAQSLANERQDLLLHQAQAGWFNTPGELVKALPVSTTPRIDSYVFEKRLSEVMSTPPVSIPGKATLREAAQRMVEHKMGALLVGDDPDRPDGIITEYDMLRATANNSVDLDRQTIDSVKSMPVECMRFDEMLYRALGRMDRTRTRHICVVDKYGRPVGMVSQRDLLQHRARGPEMLSDALKEAQDVPSLAAAYAQVMPVASRLLSEDLDGVEIARVISSELQALTRRACKLCLKEMEQQGEGTPPADWCVLVLGSGGRGESLLGADQDNALIHTGGKQDDEWFEKFGTRLADMLDASGLPRCKGGVMVMNEPWRGTLEQWNRRVDSWLRRASPDDILSVDIFFDLISVAGNTNLARQLHSDAVRVASKSPPFLGLLAQSVRSVAPRFSMFGRLPTEEGRTDLKRDGLLPLVSLARTLALRAGSRSRSTPERLRDAVAAGRIGDRDATRLIELHKLILTAILQQQIEDIEQGVPISNQVLIGQLDRDFQEALKRGLQRLNTVVGEIQSLMAG